MNTFTSVLSCLLFYCLMILPLGCSSNKVSVNTEEILLEVYTDASDSIYPPGNTLDLRVYDSGKTEFDHYLPDDLAKTLPPNPRLKQTTIGSEELAAIRSTLEELNSENPASTFAPTVRRSIDERIVVSVTYRSNEGLKTLSLTENDSRLHLNDKLDIYPKSLVKLLKLNYQLAAIVRKESRHKTE